MIEGTAALPSWNTVRTRPQADRRDAFIDLSALLLQIQGEYYEMPGLKLTEAQARRLWNLDGDTCRSALAALLEQQFLKCTSAGTYIRVE